MELENSHNVKNPDKPNKTDNISSNDNLNNLNNLNELLSTTLKLRLSETEKKLVSENAAETFFPKGTFAVKAGELTENMYLMEKGLVRGCYTDEDGNEKTKCFSSEGELFGTECFLTGAATTYSIECMENVRAVRISYSLVKKLCENPEIQRRMQDIIINDYNKITGRNRTILLLGAEERYRMFLEEYPTLDGRIKQKHIASYLGIDPVSLSRIKNKMKK